MGMESKRLVQRKSAPKRFIFTFFLIIITTSAAAGQSYYVTRPDALVMGHGQYSVSMHLAPNGGLLAGVNVGFFERLQIGLAWGGENIIGSGRIQWYNLPGAEIKVSILNEQQFPLSLAVGFNSQDPVWARYINPAGFFLVAGRNLYAGWVGFDLAVGGGYDILSQEDWHLYAVAGLKLGESFRMAPELVVYPDPWMADVLNLGISARWELYPGTGIDFMITDLLEPWDVGWTRSVRFQITQEF